jgi:SagB-type dehydrogenase family enzyme
MKNFSFHYHRITGYDRQAMSPHRLDWDGQPRLQKQYPHLPVVPLPETVWPEPADIRMVLTETIDTPAGHLSDLQQLSSALHLANGLTGRSRQGNSYFYFRSPPSAGALYPNELYLVKYAASPDLEAGVYFYDTYEHRLIRIRRGNFHAFLSETGAAAGDLLIITGIFFRSAWKYRNRAFRYVLLDGGHLLESTRLALGAAGNQGRMYYNFDDDRYNRLLGLDPDREVCLAVINLKKPDADAPSAPATPANATPANATPANAGIPDLPPAITAAGRVSPREIVYEDILDIYRAGKEIIHPHTGIPRISADDLGLTVKTWLPVKQPASGNDDPIKLSYAETVLRRRSKRNFIPSAVTEPQFLGLLDMIRRAFLTEHQETPAASRTIQAGFVSGSVDNLNPGFYLLDPIVGAIGSVHGTDLIPQMTAACLDQAWLKNAAAHFLFMTNLEKLDQVSGARGYRYTMLTAGRLGHVIYLAATAMGLGCCGIGAFYDREAEKLLGLNRSSALLYLVAVGQTR